MYNNEHALRLSVEIFYAPIGQVFTDLSAPVGVYL